MTLWAAGVEFANERRGPFDRPVENEDFTAALAEAVDDGPRALAARVGLRPFPGRELP